VASAKGSGIMLKGSASDATASAATAALLANPSFVAKDFNAVTTTADPGFFPYKVSKTIGVACRCKNEATSFPKGLNVLHAIKNINKLLKNSI
jgi:hypothetical protein